MSIENLEPKVIWQHFSKICTFPHPSGHEEKLATYLIDYAKSKGLETYSDEVGNVIIKKGPTLGYENTPKVILQAHLDMVPVKDVQSTHNFLTDPIEPYLGDDGFVHAKGTTLGADDGIGIATSLALLEDESLEHGPLTAIFTVEEETTMKGALGLSGEHLDADYLINLDSEENGRLYVGCAGSCDIVMHYKGNPVTLPEGFSALKLNLLDLKGGHSGTDIHKGHANAIVSLARLLLASKKDYDLYLGELQGGQARNSIAPNCCVTLAIKSSQLNEFKQDLLLNFESLRQKFQVTDPKMRLEISAGSEALTFIDDAQTLKVLKLIDALILGPHSWSKVDPNIVQTSCNLGVASFKQGLLELCLMARSLDENELKDVVAKETSLPQVKALGESFSFKVESEHGAWQSPASNHLINTLSKHWQQITGEKLIVTVLHAGLECGFFVKKAPSRLQLVSIGATIDYPHSPDERVDVKGVLHVFEAVRETLKELK